MKEVPHHSQVGLILRTRIWFHLPKSINEIYDINKLWKKNHMSWIDFKNHLTRIMIKMFRKAEEKKKHPHPGEEHLWKTHGYHHNEKGTTCELPCGSGPAWSLLWLRADPWSRNLHVPWKNETVDAFPQNWKQGKLCPLFIVLASVGVWDAVIKPEK